jgi:protoporphyrinogen oxidase
VVAAPVRVLDDLDVDQVVVATDAHDAARLLAGTVAETLLQVRHSPMAVVHWLAAPQERPRGFGFLVPPGDPVLGTLFMSDVLDDVAPPELCAYTTTFGGYASPDQLQRSDAALVTEVAARHARWFGAEPKIVAAHVVRWPRAVSIPSVGHRARIAGVQRLLAEQDGGRVVLAGAYLSGGTLDDAVASGFSAAQLTTGG